MPHKKLQITLGLLGIALLTSCTARHPTQDKTNEFVKHRIDEHLVQLQAGIKSLNTSFEVKIPDNYGRGFTQLSELRYTDDDLGIYAACKNILHPNNITLPYLIVNVDDADLNVDPKVIARLDGCITNYIYSHGVTGDSLTYMLADPRIKDYQHAPVLRQALDKAKADNKLTYHEIIIIYRSLDQAIALEHQQKQNQAIGAI